MKRSSSLRSAIALAAAWPGAAAAQFSDPPPPAAYAVRGVSVIQADGARVDGVDIVVRGGLITALGPGLEIPADARLLDGDSLFVYPGLIDAQGDAGYAFPEVEVDRSEVASWAPPRHLQGFLPHRRVVDHLSADGASVAEQRRKGIVAAAVHPDGRLMPGRGALLMYRKNAEVAEELVIRPELGPVMSFQGAQGVYPSTLFAVIAFYRQMFEDARRQAAVGEAYARNPEGLRAPEWDPDYAVVREALEGRVPVYFAADYARDIQRVLRLANENGFRPVIVGGEEAWKVADELKAANVPVLVSVDFPEPERWDPKKESEVEPGAVSNGDEELDAAASREKQRLEDIYSNAGRLAAAGISFALTSGGGKADILEGTRKAMEYGLSEQDALRAVTATPASLLGLDHSGRVATGMPATFVVASGPLFAEETKVRYTLVEGELEEGKKEAAGSGEAPAVDMTGTWDLAIESEGQTIAAKLILTQEGASVSGTMETPFGEAKVTEGVVSGNEVRLTIELATGQETMEIEVTGTVEGDKASGSGDSPMGAFTWTGKRTGGGPGEESDR